MVSESQLDPVQGDAAAHETTTHTPDSGDPTPALEIETIRTGGRFDFEVVRESWPDGRTIEREVVRHPGAVVVLAVDHDGMIALIRNRRIAVGGWVWELPAGTMEPPEPAELCAARELEEEAGLRAGRLDPLGMFLTSPGMTDELMHAFFASDLTPVRQRLEADERIEVHPTPVAQTLAMIDDGRLHDAKSMVAILLALRRGLLIEPSGDSTRVE